MNSMSRIFMIIIFILFSGKAFSQYGMPMKLYHPEKMKQTETIVILDYKEPLNKDIEMDFVIALQNVWKITEFRVMAIDEVMENFGNLNNKDFKNPQYSFIYLVYGHSNGTSHPQDRRMILSYFLHEKAHRSTIDPVTAIAQSEFNYDIFDREAGLRKDLELLQAQVEQGAFVTSETADPSIKEKTLYIPANLMEKGSEEKLKIYPYKYKIVSKEELSKAIKTRQPNLCFIEQTNIELPMMTVIDIETGKALYHAKAADPIVGFVQDIKSLKKSLH
jgi:hypothetical protein